MTNNDLIITPATWPGQKDSLSRTPTDLLNLVGWYGSTHSAAMWRKATEFLAVFQAEGVPGFDPQIDSWDPTFAAVEAEVMATASVIIIRLENNELLNGSLGSIAETGLALTSAALRGQAVIISIEDSMLTSLNDPGAIAQYMILEMFVEEIETNPALGGLFQLHRGNNLADLAQLACEAAQQQMTTPLAGWNYPNFLVKRDRRQQNYPRRVLLGGSSGPYAEVHRATFEQKKRHLAAPYTSEDFALKILSEGAIAEAWHIPYNNTDPLSTGLGMRTLLSIEAEYKKEADQLILPIMAEAASKAAATEIGFLLLYALTTGQEINIYLEPFDPVDYLHHHLAQVSFEADADEKSLRRALRHAGVADAVLATATRAEVIETANLISALHRAETPAFKQVKQSLLGQTEAFHAADNIRRVRTLVQAHLEKLRGDPRYPNFFTYATQI